VGVQKAALCGNYTAQSDGVRNLEAVFPGAWVRRTDAAGPQERVDRHRHELLARREPRAPLRRCTWCDPLQAKKAALITVSEQHPCPCEISASFSLET
jgi:hypothetical protein